MSRSKNRKIEEPKVEEPKVEEPKVKEPKVKEPKVEEPKVEAKKTYFGNYRVEILNVIDVEIPAGKMKKVYLADGTTTVLSKKELKALVQ